jgi:hypothetical protein
MAGGMGHARVSRKSGGEHVPVGTYGVPEASVWVLPCLVRPLGWKAVAHIVGGSKFADGDVYDVVVAMPGNAYDDVELSAGEFGIFVGAVAFEVFGAVIYIERCNEYFLYFVFWRGQSYIFLKIGSYKSGLHTGKAIHCIVFTVQRYSF